MTPILFDELVDQSGILTAIANLTTATTRFGSDSVAVNQRIKDSITQLKTELEAYKATLTSIGVSTSGAATATTGLSTGITTAGTAITRLRDALARNQQVIDVNSASVTSLRQRINDLRTEYNSLDRSLPSSAARMRAIQTELRQTATATNSLTAVTRQASATIATAQGSYQRLSQQTAELKRQLLAMPNAINAQTGAINSSNAAAVGLQRRISANTRALTNFDSSLRVNTRNVGNYGSAFKGIAGQLTGFTSIAGGVMLVLAGIKAGLDVVQDMERYDKGLQAVSRDSNDFSQSQEFLINLSDKLGLKYGDLVDSYKGLKAATKDTALEGKNTEKIFSSVATAGAKLQLSSETVQGTLLALTQMISKGKIQAEELRGQLGERLPGALKLMAEALGVSETKLNKMMEQGELIATEVMPKFAESLDKAYGLKQNEKIENMGASANRLSNQFALLLKTLNDSETITRFFSFFSDGIANTLRDLRLMVKDKAWTEVFFTTVTLGALKSPKAAARLESENMLNEFRTMSPKLRKARLELINEQASDANKDINSRMNAQLTRKKLLDEQVKIEAVEAKDRERQKGLAIKGAIDKNETDIARFQKQSVKKRTAEIIELEKQLQAKPGDVAVKSKLDLYNRLDSEQKSKDKAVSTRLKKDKPNTDTALEKIDKQIKSIEATLQSEAMKDLKAGRVMDVDQKLMDKVVKLKKEYEQIKDFQAFVERGGRIKITTKDIKKIDTPDFDRTNKTGRVELTSEQVKAEDAKKLASQITTLQKQADIFSDYANKRKKLQYDLDTDLNGIGQEHKNELLGLLEEQMSAERAGQKERVQLIQDEINQKKELYKDDLKNRKAVIDKSIEIGTTLVNGLFDLENQKNQARIQALDKSQEYELSLVGDNEGAKAEIQKKYDEQRKQIQRQQDAQARQQALFNIAVSTAVAVTEALPNIPLAIAVGILGAVQAGLVLSQPVPEYFAGKNIDGITNDNYSGPATISEKGREFWFHDGKTDLIEKPSVINVGRNDVILPNWLTERILSDDRAVESNRILHSIASGSSTVQQLSNSRDQHHARLLGMAIGRGGASADAIAKALAREIQKMPFNFTTFDQKGVTDYIQQANTRRTIQANKHQIGKK